MSIFASNFHIVFHSKASCSQQKWIQLVAEWKPKNYMWYQSYAFNRYMHIFIALRCWKWASSAFQALFSEQQKMEATSHPPVHMSLVSRETLTLVDCAQIATNKHFAILPTCWSLPWNCLILSGESRWLELNYIFKCLLRWNYFDKNSAT